MQQENSQIKGVIADYYFDQNHHILYAYSKNILRTPQLIRENVALVKSITNNQKVPLIIHLTKSPIPDKETQKISKELMTEVYTAMAMVSKPGLAQLIMKVLFSFSKPPIPMKSFTNETDALRWINSLK